MISKMGESPLQGLVAVLELIASSRPDLLDLQLETLLNSVMRFGVRELAGVLDVPVERMGLTVYRACLDLDRLEKRRGAWRDPGKVLESPNVAALVRVCEARVGRVRRVVRRRRLEGILCKLEQAHELAMSRAWIEEFIGPPVADGRGAQGVDR